MKARRAQMFRDYEDDDSEAPALMRETEKGFY